MSRVHIPALALIAAMSFGVSTAHAAETLKLDLRDPRNLTPSVAPAAQTAALAAGESYVVTVSGTGGTFGPERYPATGTCGVSDAQPTEPSPGAPVTPAGWDAQTVYAAPIGAGIGPDLGDACVNVALPAHVSPLTWTGFKVAVGTAAYGRPVPVGGIRSAPRLDHTYTYLFTGTGVPLNFKFADGPVADNSGVFTLTVRTAAECAAADCLARAGAAFDQVGPVVTPLSTPTTPPTPVVDPGQSSVKGISACSLERVLSVRLKAQKGVKISRAVYYLNGTKYRTVKGKKNYVLSTTTVRAQKFRKLPAGVLKLRVDVKTTTGKSFTLNTEYARCAPRKKARTISVKK